MNLNFQTIRFGKYCQIFGLEIISGVTYLFYASFSKLFTDAVWKFILDS